MELPGSWSEALDRLSAVLRLPAYLATDPSVEAETWLREAVHAVWGADSLHHLSREQRAICFQKLCGVVLAAEEDGIPTEVYDGEQGTVAFLLYREGTLAPVEGEPGRRERVARIFAHYFAGYALAGPPWRLSETETDRLTYEEWARGADFE